MHLCGGVLVIVGGVLVFVGGVLVIVVGVLVVVVGVLVIIVGVLVIAVGVLVVWWCMLQVDCPSIICLHACTRTRVQRPANSKRMRT